MFPARKSPEAFFRGLFASFWRTPDDASMRSMLLCARPDSKPQAGKVSPLVRDIDIHEVFQETMVYGYVSAKSR